MTDTPTKVIVDCSTGEQTIVPLTAEEIAANAIATEQALATQAAADAEAAALQATKEAAHAKLAALGLTADEIAALSK